MHEDFAQLYSPMGRPSIPPEQQLRALLVMVLYSIRSERRLMEELNYNLLYRWFVGLSGEKTVWDETVFTKNRERFLMARSLGSFSTRRWNRRAAGS